MRTIAIGKRKAKIKKQHAFYEHEYGVDVTDQQ